MCINVAGMKSRRVMIIEDEADIREVIEYNLIREGFLCCCASNGEDGLRLVKTFRPEIVLLDLMLPGLDGLDVCRHLKSCTETQLIPIIMVTAKGEERDIVLGLGLGADDYIVKPFSPKELVARTKAVLRRGPVKESIENQRIIWDGLIVDATRHEVLVDGQRTVLTAAEFKLLHFLAANPGQVFSRERLLHCVTGGGVVVLDRNIDVHIKEIRKKLGTYRDLIGTIRGVGYRFQDDRVV